MAIDPRFRQRMQQQQGRPMRPKKKDHAGLAVRLVVLVVIFSIVYIGATWALSAVSVTGISAPTNVTLKSGTPFVFSINGAEYSVRVVSSSQASGTAVVELAKSPEFINPTLRITLSANNSTRISSNGGKYADMEMLMYNLSNGSIKVTITPVAASLQLSPDSSKISFVQSPLSPLIASANLTTTISTSTSTSTATTTTAQGPSYRAIAMAQLETNHWYGLMLNFTKAYGNVQNCTSTLYNTTYAGKYGVSATGVYTYKNVTTSAPYGITFAMTNSSALFNATYKTQTPSGTTPAVYVEVNATSNTVVASGVVSSGLFTGFTYLQLKALYTNSTKIGGACGILVAHD